MVNWHKLSADLEQNVVSDPEQSKFAYPSTKEGKRFSLKKVVFIFECRKMKYTNQAILKYKRCRQLLHTRFISWRHTKTQTGECV